jgi:hypothetical protein
VLLETPIMADGYGLVSLVFHTDGTDTDTLPSALFTRTYPDDVLGVDDVLESDDLLIAEEQPERMSMAEKSKANTIKIDLIFFWFFKCNPQKSNI